MALECLLENATAISGSFKCPSCGRYVAADQPGNGASSSSAAVAGNVQILTRYLNEGGLQENYDIYPDIMEEVYLQTDPSARRNRAFLTMCGAGDVEGVIDLLIDTDDDESADGADGHSSHIAPSFRVLWYQEPLNGLVGGLHIAIENDQELVAYLLLYLASRIPRESFPPEIQQAASQYGVERLDLSNPEVPDIRTLRNERGETAESYAFKRGGQWATWAAAGLFTAD